MYLDGAQHASIYSGETVRRKGWAWQNYIRGSRRSPSILRRALELLFNGKDLAERVLDRVFERDPLDAELLLDERRVGLEVLRAGSHLGVRDARSLVRERLAGDVGNLRVVKVSGDAEVAAETTGSVSVSRTVSRSDEGRAGLTACPSRCPPWLRGRGSWQCPGRRSRQGSSSRESCWRRRRPRRRPTRC